MRAKVTLVTLIFLSVALFFWQSRGTGRSSKETVAVRTGDPEVLSIDCGKLRRAASRAVCFEKNNGQFDERVRYRAVAEGVIYWFTEDNVYYHLTRANSNNDREFENLAIQVMFVNKSPDVYLIGVDEMGCKTNYISGTDPSTWIKGASSYASVVYRDVWPGIDLRYYAIDSRMEHDFIVHPGADVGDIELNMTGIQRISVNEKDELLVETDWGSMTEYMPSVYQNIDGEENLATAEYRVIDRYTYGFQVTSSLREEYALIIDPQFHYSVYLGGSRDDLQGYYGDTPFVDAVDVGESGYAYVCGQTASKDFPTTLGAYEEGSATSGASSAAFVSKFSPDGDSLVYSTYINAGVSNPAFGIDVNSSGEVTIAGSYNKYQGALVPTFPSTTNAYNIKNLDELVLPVNSSLGYVIRLNADGDSLLYASLIADSVYVSKRATFPYSVESIGDSLVYVAGFTSDSTSVTVNAFDSTFNAAVESQNADAFLWKLNLNQSGTSSLVYSTLFGGEKTDSLWGMRLVGMDTVALVGVTVSDPSEGFPLSNHFDNELSGDQEAFLAVLRTNGSPGTQLLYSTYIGGEDHDHAWQVEVDGNNEIYVVGVTLSADFPLSSSPYDDSLGGNRDAFLMKIDPWADSSEQIIYSSYFGGGGRDRCFGARLDASENLWICGATDSDDFPLKGSPVHQRSRAGGIDAFVSKFDVFQADSSALLYSTYFGGEFDESAWAIDVDADNNACFIGRADSSGIPIYSSNESLSVYRGELEAWVGKLCTPSSDYIPGDADSSGGLAIGDAIYIFNYAADPGASPTPKPYNSGDADCSGVVDSTDGVYIINYIFSGGPAVCAPDCD